MKENETLVNRSKMLSQIITAVSNLSVQYNFQAISIALLVMSDSVCTSSDSNCKDGTQKAWVTSTASAVVFVGAIMGQLLMGYLGDLLGRNYAMVLTLSLVVVSALISAFASVGAASTIYITIIVARFFLGVGVGGVYPLSATKAAEDGGGANGVNVVAAGKAFFWQTPGAMSPWLVAYLCSLSDSMSATVQWRLLLGLGAVPAAAVVVMTMMEMRIKAQLREDMVSAGLDANNSSNELTRAQRRSLDSKREHRRKVRNSTDDIHDKKVWMGLLVTGGGWFLYDIAYYGVNLFGGEILSEISSTDDDNVSSPSALRNICQKQLIGLSLGIPACLLCIVLLKYYSTRALQVVGFILIGVMFVIMGAAFKPLRDSDPNALFAVYCMLIFSLNFGPNVTTYVLPAQTFPTHIRATMNGASAALGKVGAFVGVYIFGAVADATSYGAVMAICAGFSVLGAVLSVLAVYSPPSNAEEEDPLIEPFSGENRSHNRSHEDAFI